jgi:hypothetical protein
MFNSNHTRWILLFAGIFAAPVFAANDPTSDQVYEVARSGHLEQAEQMIDQVLRDHPKSGKAHYVAAEVYAREGKTALAGRELSTAQTLAPGLPFAKPDAVAALRRELAHGTGGAPVTRDAQPRSAIPWSTIAWIVAGVALISLIFRRRAETSTAYPVYPPNSMAPSTGALMGGGAFTGAPNVGGSGIGSGIAGGLASGLAVGAGVVAGEELARHFMDGGRNESNGVLPAAQPVLYPDNDNSDMGGNDFGLTDNSSWDDVTVPTDDDDWI